VPLERPTLPQTLLHGGALREAATGVGRPLLPVPQADAKPRALPDLQAGKHRKEERQREREREIMSEIACEYFFFTYVDKRRRHV